MARFDVFANPFAAERDHTPFVLDVQNDHLGPLATRVLIPLRSSEALDKPARGLNPLLEVDGRPLDARFRDDVHDALDALFGAC